MNANIHFIQLIFWVNKWHTRGEETSRIYITFNDSKCNNVVQSNRIFHKWSQKVADEFNNIFKSKNAHIGTENIKLTKFLHTVQYKI